MKTIKVYVLVENFVNDYKFTDGYVNTLYTSKAEAISAGNRLKKYSDSDYSFHIVERDLDIEL